MEFNILTRAWKNEWTPHYLFFAWKFVWEPIVFFLLLNEIKQPSNG